jgi:hypothetical protein
MKTATFTPSIPDFNSIVTIPIIETSSNTVVINTLFNEQVIVSEITPSNNIVTFESSPQIQVSITTVDPISVIVEKPITVTVVEDNEIKLFIADENIPKNTPVIILDNGNIAIAKTNNLDSYNRFIGINTADVQQGNEARIKISGTIFDSNFAWDINKEIYLSETGQLTQNPTSNALYLQQIANVLTPSLFLITHSEPVKYE